MRHSGIEGLLDHGLTDVFHDLTIEPALAGLLIALERTLPYQHGSALDLWFSQYVIISIYTTMRDACACTALEG